MSSSIFAKFLSADVRSCDKTTKSREAYFTSGPDVSNYRECNYNIQIINENVCQIRLVVFDIINTVFFFTKFVACRIDFEKFVLAPPTQDASGGLRCETDSLTISPNPNGVPQLCAKNSGQHGKVQLYCCRQPTIT